MLDPANAPRRAVVMLVGLAVLVLLVLAGSVLDARMVAGKGDEAGLLDRETPTRAPTPVPVIPEPVEPAPTGEAVPVAQLTQTTSTQPTEVFTPVAETTRASVVVDLAPEQEAQAREVIAQQEGVITVARITVATVDVGGVQADVAAVDPEEFRPLTPEATANHPPLWERIVAGDLATTHEFGQTHDVPLGRDVGVGPASSAVRVGAFATNGTPPVADVIIHTDRADVLGSSTRTRLLVGLNREASPTATAQALTDAGFVAQEIPDPRLPATDVVIPEGGITPENVWDHLALCESSGDWHINTGNGYYGGVQFLPESWAAVGGTGLPHEHTREEQIYRATLLWQIQGWEAWPQCARKLGLIVDPPPSELPAPPPTPAESGTASPD